jgi:hypothetical protein
MQPQQTVKVDLKDLKTVLCECGCEYFEPLIMYKIIPALYSNTGTEQLLATQGSRCVKCSKVWEAETLYKDFKDRKGIALLKQ